MTLLWEQDMVLNQEMTVNLFYNSIDKRHNASRSFNIVRHFSLVSNLYCLEQLPVRFVWAAGQWEPEGRWALREAPPDDSQTHPDTPTVEGFPAPTQAQKKNQNHYHLQQAIKA